MELVVLYARIDNPQALGIVKENTLTTSYRHAELVGIKAEFIALYYFINLRG